MLYNQKSEEIFYHYDTATSTRIASTTNIVTYHYFDNFLLMGTLIWSVMVIKFVIYLRRL